MKIPPGEPMKVLRPEESRRDADRIDDCFVAQVAGVNDQANGRSLQERLSEALLPLGLPDTPHVEPRRSPTWMCWLNNAAVTAARLIVKYAGGK